MYSEWCTTLRPCGLRVARPCDGRKGEACPAEFEPRESEYGLAPPKKLSHWFMIGGLSLAGLRLGNASSSGQPHPR